MTDVQYEQIRLEIGFFNPPADQPDEVYLAALKVGAIGTGWDAYPMLFGWNKAAGKGIGVTVSPGSVHPLDWLEHVHAILMDFCQSKQEVTPDTFAFIVEGLVRKDPDLPVSETGAEDEIQTIYLWSDGELKATSRMRSDETEWHDINRDFSGRLPAELIRLFSNQEKRK